MSATVSLEGAGEGGVGLRWRNIEENVLLLLGQGVLRLFPSGPGGASDRLRLRVRNLRPWVPQDPGQPSRRRSSQQALPRLPRASSILARLDGSQNRDSRIKWFGIIML